MFMIMAQSMNIVHHGALLLFTSYLKYHAFVWVVRPNRYSVLNKLYNQPYEKQGVK